MIAFWILAPVMVLAALGLLFVRKAVHCALLLAVVMISLAVLYAVLEAPFLFAVQIIVYTGAILMLFLFVLMLVGVDASDSTVETIKGQRFLATVFGLVFGLTLATGIAQVSVGTLTDMSGVNAGGNVPAIARILFSKYVFAFETTSLLLITAAMGAMVLAHRERLTPKVGQADLARQRMRDYAEQGKPVGPLPAPGVFARHNAVDTPALLPDGSPSEASLSRVLKARGDVRSAAALADDIVGLSADQIGHDAAPVAAIAEVNAVTTPVATVVAAAPATEAPAAASATEAPAAASATEAPAAASATEAPAAGVSAGATQDEWVGSARAREDRSQPEGYPIKGNKNSMLFHQPTGRWYAVTVAEVWFDTVASAEAAGFTEAGKRKKEGGQ